MEYRNIIIRIARVLQLLLCFILVGCVNEFDATNENAVGFLKLSLASISTETETRSTPAELGKPLADQFKLRIVSSSGLVAYDDYYKDETLTIPVGNYSIEASYGNNPALGIDAPYYIGSASAEIQENQTISVSIPCSVGNALVSARFGDPEKTDDAERFERYYSDYALYVFNGSNSIPITKEHPDYSVYLRAGSPVKLMFWGKLKMQDNREVSCEVVHKDLPKILSAADHLIVTLTLSNPESSVLVDISKVEIETVTLEETIPLSWLPISTVAHSHQYDAQGNLVGTNLMFTNSYPGMKWKAVVKNAAGTTVRAVQGTDALFSEYSKAGSWPYLPSGEYTAYYYLIGEDDSENLRGSRTFRVSVPRLTITIDAFTSYTKYLEGNIETANETGPNGDVGFYGRKIRNVSARLMVADDIVNDPKYASLKSNVTAAVDGTTLFGTATGNTFFAANTEDLSRDRHTISASGSFDGGTASESKSYDVTGLPYLADSESSFSEWSPGGDYSKWANDTPTTQEGDGAGACYYFRGDNKVSGEAYLNIYTPRFNVPGPIKIQTGFSIWIYCASSAIPLVGNTDMMYCNYGPASSKNVTPDADMVSPLHQIWNPVNNSTFVLDNATPFLSWQWHHDVYKVGQLPFYGYYWWGINNVKILYR